jgi:hypothetical protein
MGPEFEAFSRDIALPLVRKHAGLRSVQVGAPRPGAPNIYCVSMVWDGVEALKEFAGDTWTEALVEPEEEHLVASISVEHYDLVAAAGGAEA